MQHSDVDRSIVQTIIDLAHNLKFQVVAEGVETQEQSRELADMGCDIFSRLFV